MVVLNDMYPMSHIFEGIKNDEILANGSLKRKNSEKFRVVWEVLKNIKKSYKISVDFSTNVYPHPMFDYLYLF